MPVVRSPHCNAGPYGNFVKKLPVLEEANSNPRADNMYQTKTTNSYCGLLFCRELTKNKATASRGLISPNECVPNICRYIANNIRHDGCTSSDTSPINCKVTLKTLIKDQCNQTNVQRPSLLCSNAGLALFMGDVVA